MMNMNNAEWEFEGRTLTADLIERALCGTDHPARAVSLLMSAAATILERHFGAAASIDLMHQALDETGAALRAQRQPGGSNERKPN